MEATNRVIGPKVPPGGNPRDPYRRPLWLFGFAGLLLVASIFLPYWRLELVAPQYPDGLVIDVYVNDMVGRQIAVAGILALVGLLVAGFFIHSRWVLLFAVPAAFFPVVFLLDLQYWLYRYGHDLDPAAPFANAVGEFTPPVLGAAEIAQFDTMALPLAGLWMAIAATVLIAVGLWLHRKAFKPLIEQSADTR